MNIQEGNTFTISKHFTAFVNRFDLFDEEGVQIGFAEQKRFNLREHITVWKSDAKDEVLFSIEAEKVFDVHGKYPVTDADGTVVGYLQKQFVNSLLRSTWGVYDANNTLLYTAQEKNIIIALVRRLALFMPFGEILEQLPLRFDLLHEGNVIGYHKRIFGLRDKYEIALEPEFAHTEKRVLLALGLLLDILQQR